MIRLFLLSLGCLSAVMCGAGCANDKPQDPNAVSTIPWNRPERWEGQGPMGGMMPGAR